MSVNYEQDTLTQAQHDILTGNLKTNDLLKPHVVLALNKALKSKNQTIINAINEVLQKAESVDTKFVNFADAYNDILMDVTTPDGQTEFTKMQTIAPTVIEAINRLNGGISKTISFQFFKQPKSTEKLTIKSPYSGEITNISAYCSTAPTIDTQLTIEKISESDFASGGIWTDILSNPTTIKAGELIDDKTVLLLESKVVKDEIFRVKMLNSSDLEDLNVQIEYSIM